mgnify:CR=1 FL=1
MKISFVSNRPWLTENAKSVPSLVSKSLPAWYRKSDRFFKNPQTGDFLVGEDGGKFPTYKACPALLDVMTSGYTLNTPCDVEIFINDNGLPDCKIMDRLYFDFCTTRPPMNDFQVPYGYNEYHFAWNPDWGVKLPKGYSAMFLSPINRFELPFHTVGGIIDNDEVDLMGQIPFFIQKDFVGIIPAGTPYIQIFPFKREDWESEYVLEKSPMKLYNKNFENSKKYRIPNGGFYKNFVWNKRQYK